nr:MAG TPA: Prokaryotic membrane lipoprotein lipid attachment site [Crassvirales sp.]DAP08896.1 MAG TPA: Prokaryotic membrane lipoprotein lipid attachment site [Crassvirales sp.]
MKKILFLLFMTLLLGSCKVKEKIVEVPVPQIKTEIKYIDKVKYDSIYLKDSVYIIQKGDTVYNTKVAYRYKYKYLKDTITINKADTITRLQKVTEIKVKNQLNVVQKVLMYIGLFSLLMFIIIIYKHFKK